MNMEKNICTILMARWELCYESCGRRHKGNSGEGAAIQILCSCVVSVKDRNNSKAIINFFVKACYWSFTCCFRVVWTQKRPRNVCIQHRKPKVLDFSVAKGGDHRLVGWRRTFLPPFRRCASLCLSFSSFDCFISSIFAVENVGLITSAASANDE